MSALAELKQRSAELTDLHNVLALLQWDQEVSLPRRADRERALQLATLSGLIHRRETDEALGRLLEEAREELEGCPVNDRALVRIMRRQYEQKTRLPNRFVSEFARLVSEAQRTWLAAREAADFTLFSPCLERIVTMSRRQAEFLGYAAHPLDALLDLHEEGLTTAAVEQMFSGLREPLQQMVAGAQGRGRMPPLHAKPFSRQAQEDFVLHLLTRIGFDFHRGALARSAHPFTTSLGHHDRRITNRYAPRSLEFLFGALHEGGHALYEQGIAEELGRSQLDGGVSLGIHESQSRLWENIIGRSQSFWKYFFPELQRFFPEQFSTVALEEFVRGINAIAPGLIRVEADEASYNLHICIRFELERDLLAGTVKVAELPELWREKYRGLLGLEVDNDANGVLQDIHWAHGSLGYFPTYTIGNILAAQFWEAYKKDDPDFEQTLATGNFGAIRRWLTENIYRFGSVHTPAELVKKVTGEELNPGYFLRYLETKFSF